MTQTASNIEYLIYQRPDRSTFYGKPFEMSEDRGERVISTSFHQIDAEYICKAISSYERSHAI